MSGRSPHWEVHSARPQFGSGPKSRESLTTDDILNLKREKQNLIRERTLLKAKLVRYGSFSRHPKPAGRNRQIANSLEREVQNLEQLTAAKRAEIAQLIYSDRAALITELQEESKMLHLELMRLQKTKQETENELRVLSAQLDEDSQKYSPAVLARQDAQIRALEREVAAQRTKNNAITERIAAMKCEQESDQSIREAARTQQKIEQLKAQIRKEQQEIAAIDKQMEQMNVEHAAEMQQLQSLV
jgi:chromosome segregation ATPase